MIKLGKWITKHRVIILIVAVVLLIPSVLGMVATRINYDMLNYLPDTMETIQGQDILLEDFGKEGVTECIQELCGIPEMIAEIRTSQDNFVQVNDAYTANSVNKSASASSFKKMLFFAINDKLLPYLSAMQLANAKAYGQMASKVECEIARVNEIVNKRKKTATPKNPTEKTAE